MDRYIDVIQRSFELLQTMEEGLEYMHSRIQEGEYEASIVMMQDVSVAYSVLGRSLFPVLEKLLPNKIEELGNKFQQALIRLLAAYEQRTWGDVEATLSHVLMPCYRTWKVELEKQLQPYILL